MAWLSLLGPQLMKLNCKWLEGNAAATGSGVLLVRPALITHLWDISLSSLLQLETHPNRRLRLHWVFHKTTESSGYLLQAVSSSLVLWGGVAVMSFFFFFFYWLSPSIEKQPIGSKVTHNKRDDKLKHRAIKHKTKRRRLTQPLSEKCCTLIIQWHCCRSHSW